MLSVPGLSALHPILIESQWNLKTALPSSSGSGASDINRITVEFKGSRWLSGFLRSHHINRITVEFKVVHTSRSLNEAGYHINRITVEFKVVKGDAQKMA